MAPESPATPKDQDTPATPHHDIHRPAKGGLHGWQRLHRFRAVMAFATIDVADPTGTTMAAPALVTDPCSITNHE